MTPRRPRLALPFTILTAPDRVRLVAGEDYRYTLAGPGLDSWLPAWLGKFDGRLPLDEALQILPPEQRETAQAVVARLAGERVLVEGPVAGAASPRRYRLAVEGDGSLRAVLEALPMSDSTSPALPVLVQDRLDLDEALRFNDRCLRGAVPWLWLSTGPMARGYVGPAFLPDAGPCLACLLGHFRKLSPVPELYDELIEHRRQGKELAPVPFPEHGVAVLAQLALGKLDWLALDAPPSALYRLHVLELDSLEVNTHAAFIDPDCPACGGRR